MSKILDLIAEINCASYRSVMNECDAALVSNQLNAGHLVTVDGAKPLHFKTAPVRDLRDWYNTSILVKDDKNNVLGELRVRYIEQIAEGVYTLKCGGPDGITVVAHDLDGRKALLSNARFVCLSNDLVV